MRCTGEIGRVKHAEQELGQKSDALWSKLHTQTTLIVEKSVISRVHPQSKQTLTEE